ncbi:MAG: hypothetical protein ACD_63C00146G0011 [uncultured bacterium]|nr:MAG: hypothetical protein ACD_63C00146G0011 [uncultured bacterium]
MTLPVACLSVSFLSTSVIFSLPIAAVARILPLILFSLSSPSPTTSALKSRETFSYFGCTTISAFEMERYTTKNITAAITPITARKDFLYEERFCCRRPRYIFFKKI